MGVSVPVGETQCALRWRLTGDNDEMVCTFGVRDPTTTDPDITAATVYASATAAGGPTPAANLLTNWTFVGVTTYLQDDPGQVIGEFNAPISGTSGATTSLPQNCCMLIKKHTASSGRSNRGRMFTPPFNLAEANVDQNGAIAGGTVTSVQTDWDFFLSELVNEGLEPVLFHSEPTASTTITSLVVDPIIATQRRRLR